jgi:hypothetical protein
MWTRDTADTVLSNINEPALTDVEFSSMDVTAEIYGELSKVIQNYRGGAGAAYEKLAADAKINGVLLIKKQYSNVFIGEVLE